MSLPMVMESGESWFGPPSWWFRLWMLLRGLFGGASLLFKFHALEHISLANTTVIVMSTPIFVFLFARIFLHESFGRYHALSLALSVIGIGCASNLDVLFGETQMDQIGHNVTVNVLTDKSHHTLIGNLYAIASTILSAIVFVIIRKVRYKV